MAQLPPINEVKRFFPSLRKDVLECLLLLVSCLFRSRTVCLYKTRSEASLVLGQPDLNLDSVYTRFIRFFKMKHIDACCVGLAWLVIQLAKIEGSVYLVMDRTNWKIGKTNINILVVGLLITDRIFVPVLWKMLDKRGNSHTTERQELVSRFLAVWKNLEDRPVCLLADREFIGLTWFDSLRQACISMVIRVRWQDYWHEIAAYQGKTVAKIERLIRRKVTRNGFFQSRFVHNGQVYFYTAQLNNGSRKGKDEWLILVSDKSYLPTLNTEYAKRWGIEIFFFHSKTNGFNLEDLRLEAPKKVQLMMALVAIAYVLSIKVGQQKAALKPIKTKKSKGNFWLEISVFRLGFDHIRATIYTMANFLNLLNSHLKAVFNPRFPPKIVLNPQNVQ